MPCFRTILQLLSQNWSLCKCSSTSCQRLNNPQALISKSLLHQAPDRNTSEQWRKKQTHTSTPFQRKAYSTRTASPSETSNLPQLTTLHQSRILKKAILFSSFWRTLTIAHKFSSLFDGLNSFIQHFAIQQALQHAMAKVLPSKTIILPHANPHEIMNTCRQMEIPCINKIIKSYCTNVTPWSTPPPSQ